MRLLVIMCAMLFVPGCGGTGRPDAEQSAPTTIKAYAGAFVVARMQHPILAEGQRYFQPAGTQAEWVAVVPVKLLPQVESGQKVKVLATRSDVDLGGPAATKHSYKGTRIDVVSITPVP